MCWVGEPVDYLKIDWEGAEHYILDETSIEPMRNVRNLDLDMHNLDQQIYINHGQDIDRTRLVRCLAESGFDVPDILHGHAGILHRRE